MAERTDCRQAMATGQLNDQCAMSADNSRTHRCLRAVLGKDREWHCSVGSEQDCAQKATKLVLCGTLYQSQLMGLLDEHANIVANDLAQHLVDPRHMRLAAYVVSKLGLDNAEGALNVAALSHCVRFLSRPLQLVRSARCFLYQTHQRIAELNTPTAASPITDMVAKRDRAPGVLHYFQDETTRPQLGQVIVLGGGASVLFLGECEATLLHH